MRAMRDGVVVVVNGIWKTPVPHQCPGNFCSLLVRRWLPVDEQ
jgi:hypothetical protein